MVGDARLTNEANWLVGPNTGGGSEVGETLETIAMVAFPVSISLAKDIVWGADVLSEFISPLGVGPVVSKVGNGDDVVTREETAEEAAQVTKGADSNGDEAIVTIDNLAKDLVGRERSIREFVGPSRPASKLQFLSVL